MTLRQQAEDLYKPPFRYVRGYIFDANNEVVSERGWGHVAFLPNAGALHKEVGQMLADALNMYYELKRYVP